jgi:hypothetical protein
VDRQPASTAGCNQLQCFDLRARRETWASRGEGQEKPLRPERRQGKFLRLVGARGFEPRTSCSRSRRANRAALRPVFQRARNVMGPSVFGRSPRAHGLVHARLLPFQRHDLAPAPITSTTHECGGHSANAPCRVLDLDRRAHLRGFLMPRHASAPSSRPTDPGRCRIARRSIASAYRSIGSWPLSRSSRTAAPPVTCDRPPSWCGFRVPHRCALSSAAQVRIVRQRARKERKSAPALGRGAVDSRWGPTCALRDSNPQPFDP